MSGALIHGQTVSRDRVAMVDAILSGKPLNVGRIISKQIYVCANRKKSSLPFPSLISALCFASDVPIADEEERLKLGGVIIPAAIARIVHDKVEQDPPSQAPRSFDFGQ